LEGLYGKVHLQREDTSGERKRIEVETDTYSSFTRGLQPSIFARQERREQVTEPSREEEKNRC